MRLVIATTILANSIPLSSSLSSSSSAGAPAGAEASSSSSPSSSRASSSSLSSKRRYLGQSTSLKQLIQRMSNTDGMIPFPKQEQQQQGVLKNIDVMVECDPSVVAREENKQQEKEEGTSRDQQEEDETEAADLGVLSCGLGKYCLESTSSSLGGYCAPSSSSSTSASAYDDDVRELQQVTTGDEEDDDLFTFAYEFFCDRNTTTTDYAQNCDCTNVNVESMTLDVSCVQPSTCTVYTNMCDVNVTNCYSVNFDLKLTGPGMYSYVRCFEDTAPYVQKNCYYGSASQDDVLDQCTVSLDDVTCNSCQTTPYVYESCDEDDVYGTVCENFTSNCFEFDCTNTIARKAGNNCDDNVYIPPILYYLQTYGCEDLYICDICGGPDFVATKPQGQIDVGEGITTCAAVAQVALLGGFNETFCNENVIPAVADDCGCTPAPAPTEAPIPSGGSLRNVPLLSSTGNLAAVAAGFTFAAVISLF